MDLGVTIWIVGWVPAFLILLAWARSRPSRAEEDPVVAGLGLIIFAIMWPLLAFIGLFWLIGLLTGAKGQGGD